MKREMLRVGLMLESAMSTAWAAGVIDEIASSDFACVEAIIFAPAASAQEPSFLYTLYERWDYRRNVTAHDALAVVDLSSALSAVPALALRPGLSSTPEIEADQFNQIESFHLDVIFRLCSATAPYLAGAAKFGVWSFCFDNEQKVCDKKALFWPVFDRSPVAPCVLQILTKTGVRIAYEGQAASDPASLYRTRNPVCWKLAAAAVRALQKLHLDGAKYLESLPVSSAVHSQGLAGQRTFSSVTMLRFYRREMSRWLGARVTSLRSRAVPKWCICIRRRGPAHTFDDPSGYTMMASAADRFFADPFLVEKDGKTFLFFEDFRYDEGRAVISVCELDDDGRPGVPVEVLRRPYHLSYPFLFEEGGEIYMIPETRGSFAIEIYRATDFPFGWVQEGNLISDIAAVDTTIQRVGDKLWMFTGISNGAYSNSDELWLYSADHLSGPWRPHPKNPVISDVQRARPAGMMFHEAGRLIRPSQDCGKAYGYALVFSEVVTLTESEYEERVIGHITPDLIPHAISNHTYNRSESFEVVDRTLPASIANGQGA